MTSILFWHFGRFGAGAKYTHDFSVALGEEGRAPSAVVAVAGGELADICKGDVRRVPRLPERGLGRRARWRHWFGVVRLPTAFACILDDVRPDVAVCTFQTVWDVLVLAGLRRRGVRYVLVLHDSWFRAGDVYPLRSWSLRRQVAAADGIVVLTDHSAAQVKRAFGVTAERIVTIPHPAFVFASNTKIPRYRGVGPLRLLFLGRLITYKGLDLLVEAYRQMRAGGIDARLEIAGHGDLGTLAVELAELPDVCLLQQWLSETEMAAALARNDVVVLPYREATQSGIAAAAFAAAMPVVATPVGGLVEQVGRAGGVLAAAPTPAALAEAITSLNDPGRFAEVSAAALHHAEVDLTWSAAARRLIDFCDHVAALPRTTQKRRRMIGTSPRLVSGASP